MAKQEAARKSNSAETLRTIAVSGTEDADPMDRVIHERLRLAIVSALAVNASLTFSELKSLLGTTDGNLSVHARKLEEAGLIACTKGYEGRTPRTDFSITDAGRQALNAYLAHMERLIKVVKERPRK